MNNYNVIKNIKSDKIDVIEKMGYNDAKVYEV